MRTGRYRHVASLQAASSVTMDPHRGRIENFTSFGTWRCAITDQPMVKTEQDAVVMYLLEGLWRKDAWDKFSAGKTVRVVAKGMTLKALAMVNVGQINMVLQIHAARVGG